MSNDCLVAVCCVVCVVVQKWDDLASRGGEIKISDLTKNGMTVTKKSQLIEIIFKTKSFIDFAERKGDCYYIAAMLHTTQGHVLYYHFL